MSVHKFQIFGCKYATKFEIFLMQYIIFVRISFTGMFNSIKGHMVTADIVRKSSSTIRFLGRASAQTTEAGGVFGKRYSARTDERR